jgi:flagellar basal-body rod protein FlgB
MIDGIDKAMNFQANALILRAQRQQVLASNIANADTPGYQAADIDFAAALERATAAAPGTGAGPARTAPTHLAPISAAIVEPRPASATGALDGNSVDMDAERVHFADNALRYEAALRFLNGKIRTLLSAIQG